MDKFLKISYTGRIKGGGIIDTTNEEIARKEGVFDENRIYRPMPVVAGQGQVIKGIDEVLGEMKKGEERTIEIPPEKGYGNRDPNLVRLVPIRVFKQQNIRPMPGMMVELDGRPAKIQTVAGGRVRVDFNPELAGKTLIYEVRVEDVARKKEDKVRFLIDRSFRDPENFGIRINKKSLEIELPENAYKDRNILVRKASLAGEIFKFLDFTSIRFIETWKKPE